MILQGLVPSVSSVAVFHISWANSINSTFMAQLLYVVNNLCIYHHNFHNKFASTMFLVNEILFFEWGKMSAFYHHHRRHHHLYHQTLCTVCTDSSMRAWWAPVSIWVLEREKSARIWTPCHSAHSLVTVLTILSWLHYLWIGSDNCLRYV